MMSTDVTQDKQGTRIPRVRLPGAVAWFGARLPQWPHAVALCTALNLAVRMRVLPPDSVAQLEQRTFRVVVSDTGGEARFTWRNGVARPLLMGRHDYDLTLRANAYAFLRLLMRQEDPDTLFFNRELAIEGDTELGLIVKNMLDAVDFAELSRIFRGRAA
jgi:predicted lipid carrier protein YhbT